MPHGQTSILNTSSFNGIGALVLLTLAVKYLDARGCKHVIGDAVLGCSFLWLTFVVYSTGLKLKEAEQYIRLLSRHE